MFAMKYQINDGDWIITHRDIGEKTEVLTEFSFFSKLFGFSPSTAYMVLSVENESLSEEGNDTAIVTAISGLTKDNVPEFFRNVPIPHTENRITIKKMTTKELESLGKQGYTDIFSWLKSKVAKTTDIPEGFELPIVNKDTITLYSNAMITIIEVLPEPEEES